MLGQSLDLDVREIKSLFNADEQTQLTDWETNALNIFIDIPNTIIMIPFPIEANLTDHCQRKPRSDKRGNDRGSQMINL